MEKEKPQADSRNIPIPAISGDQAPIPVYVNLEAGLVAGAASAVEGAIMENFKRYGISAEIHPTEPDRMTAEVLAEVQKGTRLVAICGGDGTVSSTAGVLAETNVILAPIPTGSLNHFARRYNIFSIEDAVEAIASGRVRRISVGEVNEVVFVNNVSCGIYPFAVRQKQRFRRYLSKWPATAIGWVAALAHFPSLELTIDIEGEQIKRRTAFLWVGIGRESFQLPRMVQPTFDANVLEVVVTRAQTRLQLIALGFSVVFNLMQGRRLRNHWGVEILHSRKLALRSRGRVDIARDGEVGRIIPPLSMQLRPCVLQVVVGKRA